MRGWNWAPGRWAEDSGMRSRGQDLGMGPRDGDEPSLQEGIKTLELDIPVVCVSAYFPVGISLPFTHQAGSCLGLCVSI